MKKILYTLFTMVIAFTAITDHANAQTAGYSYTKQSPDTVSTSSTTGTTAATVLNMPSKIKSITGRVEKLSGTFPTGAYAISGVYAVLQGTNDNSGVWEDVNTDSLKCLNQAINKKTWVFTSTSFNSYRVSIRVPSSTQTSTVYLIYCKRQDE
jgi:hypothetical protein